MSVQNPANRADLWQFTPSVEIGGRVKTGTYARVKTDVLCDLQDIAASESWKFSLNVTDRARMAFLPASLTRSDLSDTVVVWDLDEGSAWACSGPPRWSKAEVSDGHWELLLTELKTPHKEIAEAY